MGAVLARSSFALLTVCLVLACSCAWPTTRPTPAGARTDGKAPKHGAVSKKKAEPAKREKTINPLLWPLAVLIDRHRTHGTKWDGNRCPMYPSCSAFGQRALVDHGFLGLLLIIDRLFYRETGNLGGKYMLTPRRLSGARRHYDPVADSLPGTRPSLLLEGDFGR